MGDRLKDVDIDSLVKDLYIYTEDEFARELVNNFEKQLYIAKLRPKEFSSGLYKFMETNAKFIRDNKYFKEFYEFSYFIYSEMNTKNLTNRNIFYAYQDLLLQQMTHLYDERLIYGIESNGEAFICNEVFPKLDFAGYEFEKKFGRNAVRTMEKERAKKIVTKLYKKYGYDFDLDKRQDLKAIVLEQGIVRNIFQMTPFINESTLDIHAFPPYNHIYGMDIPLIEVNRNEVKEKIRTEEPHKIEGIPFRGIIAKLNNCGEIDEILIKERIYANKVILLFNVKAKDGKYTNGFCELDREIEFSVWKDSSKESYHHKIMNLVISVYYLYVYKGSGEGEIGKNIKIKTVEKFNIAEPEVVEVRFVENARQYNYLGSEGTRSKDLGNYDIATKDIEWFVRKLPTGHVASEEAYKKARELGYILKEGETFVSPHSRTVYKKKEDG